MTHIIWVDLPEKIRKYLNFGGDRFENSALGHLGSLVGLSDRNVFVLFHWSDTILNKSQNLKGYFG